MDHIIWATNISPTKGSRRSVKRSSATKQSRREAQPLGRRDSPEDRETNSLESGTVLKSNDYEITIEDDDSENEEWVIEDESPNEND